MSFKEPASEDVIESRHVVFVKTLMRGVLQVGSELLEIRDIEKTEHPLVQDQFLVESEARGFTSRNW
jgi:hypothetical protein